jgi:hypothetical protein
MGAFCCKIMDKAPEIVHTYISSIHNIPQGAFGYETLSDKKYINDNRSLLRIIQDTTDNSVKYYIHNILILSGPN